MTPFEQLIQNLIGSPFSFWLLIKTVFVGGLVLYLAFAVIVIRQVRMMSQTIEGISAWPLRVIAWIHLGVAIFILLLSILIL